MHNVKKIYNSKFFETLDSAIDDELFFECEGMNLNFYSGQKKKYLTMYCVLVDNQVTKESLKGQKCLTNTNRDTARKGREYKEN